MTDPQRSSAWSRLRQAWTRYDGKPWEEWTQGPNLKETVLIVLLAATLVGWAVVVALMLFDMGQSL